MERVKLCKPIPFPVQIKSFPKGKKKSDQGLAAPCTAE